MAAGVSDSSSEVEAASVAQVQEVLEHAFPNGLTTDVIAESLRYHNSFYECFITERNSHEVFVVEPHA